MSASSTSHNMANEKQFRSASYALVFLMMACIVLTTSILVGSLLPDWHAGVIAGILLFVVIDRLYTYRQLKSLTFLSREWAINVGAQWVVIALCSRVLLSYANGPDALIADLSFLARGDLGELFTAEFVVTLFLAFIMWVLPAHFLELLDEIGLDMRLALKEEQPIQGELVPAHQRMAGLIFTTGVVLVILTAMTRLNLRNILANTAGLPSVEWSRFSGAEAGALLYFVFGLALLSLSRLMSLQTQWNRLHIPVSSANLPRQWAMYSLYFLLALALAVSLLPAGESLGLISVVGTLFAFLFGVFVFLAQLLIGLLLILASLPFLLFGQPPPFVPGSAPPPMPTLPTQPITPPTGSNEMLDLIRSIILWGSLLVIIVYALVRFVKQHDQILGRLRSARIVNWLRLAWQWLYKNADQASGSVVRAIKDGWQNIFSRLDGKRILSRPGWISVRSLDPRRRVYFFYLTMLRRAGEHGLRRDLSQTPFEYAAKLEEEIPSADQDIDSLTQAFVHARYSRREIDSSEANAVKAAWDRIRRALQSKAKKDKSTNL